MQKRKDQQFKRNIANILGLFERNREWADIGNWLYKLEDIVKNHKFNKLPEKFIVGKRLAQCLNPTLPPGVHTTALRVYDHIFSNCQDRIQLYPALSMGLFAFFQYSTSVLKFEVLKIIEKFYVDSISALPMIVALSNSILTGLNQNHEQLAKKIYLVFDKIDKLAGKKWVDGAVWVNILKSPKIRIAGFKYLIKVFRQRDKQRIKNGEPQTTIVNVQLDLDGPLAGQIMAVRSKMKERIQSFLTIDNHQTRFPNISCLVVNALLCCLTEGQSLVQRSALDLMIGYLGIHQKFLLQQDKEILVQACLHLLLKKQFPLVGRVYKYLFGSPDPEGHHTIGQEHTPVLRIIEKSFIRILQEDHNTSPENPVLILEYLFKQHQALINIMLPTISYSLLSYVSANQKKQSVKLQKSTINLLTCIKSSLTLFLDSIVKTLEGSNDQHALKTIQLLDYYFFGLVSLKPQFSTIDTIKDVVKIILKSIVDLKHDLQEFQFVNESLQFCIKLLTEASKNMKIEMDFQCIGMIEQLIEKRPIEYIYSSLLYLHPKPKHQFLLPFISQGPLSLICLKFLVNSDTSIAEEQLDNTFVNLFRLLQCHLWEDQAIVLIKTFQTKYQQTYKKCIQHSEVSHWQIYWKKLNGDIKGAGVIRMLKFLDHENPIKRHTSQTWLQQSSSIISKILLPVFKVISNEAQPEIHIQMFHILKNIITNMSKQVPTFIFCQKQHFLIPLLNRIFLNIQSILNQKIKSDSIEFLNFLLAHVESEQKYQMIEFTLPRVLQSLQNMIDSTDYLSEIQILIFISNAVQDFLRLTKWKGKLVALLQSENFLSTILHGLTSSNISYVKSQYIKFLTELGDVLKGLFSKKSMSLMVNLILQRYFLILRETDVNKIEQIIQGKRLQENRRKASNDFSSEKVRPRKISNSGKVLKNESFKGSFKASLENEEKIYKQQQIENKYNDIILVWNALKFYVNFSIANELEEFRIDSLLSLILNSFPFCYLQYRQYNPVTIGEITREVYEQIKSMSGLRKQVLEIFDIIWKRFNKQILNLLIQKSDPRILVHSNLDPTIVMTSLINSINLKQIKNFYKGLKLNLPRGCYHYNRDTLIQENKFLYFTYLYLTYCNLQNNKNRNEFWVKAFEVIRSVAGASNHTQTGLWVMEISSVLFQRSSYKEIGLETRERLYVQEMIKSLVDECAQVITKSKEFTQKLEIKTGLMGLFTKEQKDQRTYDFIKIFPPTIYELELIYQEHKHENDYYIEDNLFSKCFNTTEGNYKNSLVIAASKTLSAIGVQLIYATYEGESFKILNVIKDLIVAILPVCDDKKEENQYSVELVSQIIHKLINSTGKPEILKLIKKPIFDSYMANDFFKCTKKTLSYWRDILDSATQIEDLLSELLSKQTLFSGLFTAKAESTRLKIKSFERICFLIYAGKIDKYQNKLRNLLESLNEVIKQGQNTHPSLLILILFCIRILVIRLSPASLNKMFKTLWPSLMALLLQIFQKRKMSKHPNLILAALKVVQLLHAMEIQQFNLHKWMFIFDYFGIHLEPLSIEEQQRFPESFITPFQFEPFLMNLLPSNSFKCNFIPVLYEKEELATTFEVTYRKMIIKQPSVETENQLRNHAFLLIQYLINLNQKRVKPNKQAIEAIIETDFISLDDYIFDIK